MLFFQWRDLVQHGRVVIKEIIIQLREQRQIQQSREERCRSEIWLYKIHILRHCSIKNFVKIKNDKTNEIRTRVLVF